MTALSVPASIARTWFDMCGGKKSMMRLIVSGASSVWSVDSTRWPVSAADRAVATVSSSRISPTRITSGSWRSTRRSARLNEAVSWPTSRWLITERLSWCRNSIGSSIVTMCFACVRVDLVDHRRERRGLARAGRAGEQDDPALFVGDLGDDRRQAELVDRLDLVRHRAQTIEIAPRWWKALTRKRARPGTPKEKSTSCSSANSSSLSLSFRRLREDLLGVLGGERLRARDRLEHAVAADERRRRDLEVEVRAIDLDDSAQGSVEIEHMGLLSAARRSGLRAAGCAERTSSRRRRGASAPPRATAASSATGSRSGGSARASR